MQTLCVKYTKIIDVETVQSNSGVEIQKIAKT